MAYARSQRHEGEIELVQEEMRTVLSGLEWQTSDWLARGGDLSTVSDPAQKEALVAYRTRQASIRSTLRSFFQIRWSEVEGLVTSSRLALSERQRVIDEEDVEEEE